MIRSARPCRFAKQRTDPMIHLEQLINSIFGGQRYEESFKKISCDISIFLVSISV